MFVQKDVYPDILANYKKFNKDTKNVDYSGLISFKAQKETINLIENLRVNSLTPAPILNSDKKQAPFIRPYSQFKGTRPLPQFKNDLKSWSIVC